MNKARKYLELREETWRMLREVRWENMNKARKYLELREETRRMLREVRWENGNGLRVYLDERKGELAIVIEMMSGASLDGITLAVSEWNAAVSHIQKLFAEDA